MLSKKQTSKQPRAIENATPGVMKKRIPEQPSAVEKRIRNYGEGEAKCYSEHNQCYKEIKQSLQQPDAMKVLSTKRSPKQPGATEEVKQGAMNKAKPKAAGCTKQKAFITHLCLSQSIPPPLPSR